MSSVSYDFKFDIGDQVRVLDLNGEQAAVVVMSRNRSGNFYRVMKPLQNGGFQMFECVEDDLEKLPGDNR